MLKKSNVTDAQLQKVLKKIRKVNNYMEQDYMAETVMDSLLGIESTYDLIYIGNRMNKKKNF